MWANFRIAFRGPILLAGLLLLGSCDNKFDSFSDTTDDESLLYSAKKGLRDADYDAAIEACAAMSTAFLAEGRVAEVCASAYAGRCGFKVTTMVSDIETYTTSVPPEKIFHWFLTQIPASVDQDVLDCATAEGILRGLGDASERTPDQNALMTLLSIRTIAMTLKRALDTDNDEALDGGFDACAISAAHAQVIGSAFWEFDKTLDELSSNSFYAPLDTAVDALCTALSGLAKDLCGATSPEGLGAAALLGARTLMKEGAVVGVDQCGSDGTVVTCNCP